MHAPGPRTPNPSRPGKHRIVEMKLVCPLSASEAGTHANGALAAFGNTVDPMRAIITGAPASRGAAAVEGAYHTSLRKGHSVHAIIHETFGGFSPGAVAMLYELGRKHGSRLGADEKAAPWCARSFRALHAMRISVAIHKASASEILETIQLDVASNVAHGELA